MNITTLFEDQMKKNENVIIDTNLNEYKLSARKNLELHIKLSALADETKCYKYWKDSNNSLCKDAIFQKYLDCLSLILTMGLDRDYSDVTTVTLKPNDYCLSDQFLNLYIDLNDIIISNSKDHYLTLLEDFISLGITLGYSECKIKETFLNI